MDITYGMDIKSHENKFLQAAERAMQQAERTNVPGAFLVDTIPIRVFATSSSFSTQLILSIMKSSTYRNGSLVRGSKLSQERRAHCLVWLSTARSRT